MLAALMAALEPQVPLPCPSKFLTFRGAPGVWAMALGPGLAFVSEQSVPAPGDPERGRGPDQKAS